MDETRIINRVELRGNVSEPPQFSMKVAENVFFGSRLKFPVFPARSTVLYYRTGIQNCVFRTPGVQQTAYNWRTALF